MWKRWHTSGLILLLLALGVCGVSVSPPRRDEAPPPKHRQALAGSSHTLSDLDGDGLADSVLLDPGNLHYHIELHLSRTDERVALPVGAAADGGSLSAQDLDGDGDTDLLWQEALPSHTVRVWLNDGTGRFECLCPPDAHARRFIIGSPGVTASHSRRPDCVLSSGARSASPGHTLAARWDFHGAAARGSHRPEPVRIVSARKRLLSTRSPPLQLC
jgi:hypothetical protein